MKAVLKTDYNDYIKIFKRKIDYCWVGFVFIFFYSFPFYAGKYFVSLLTTAGFYSIVGLSLFLLLGLAGQVSLGHAACPLGDQAFIRRQSITFI